MPQGRGHVGRVLPRDLSVEWGRGPWPAQEQQEPSPAAAVAAGMETRGPIPCVLAAGMATRGPIPCVLVWKLGGTEAFSQFVEFTRFSVTSNQNGGSPRDGLTCTGVSLEFLLWSNASDSRFPLI